MLNFILPVVLLANVSVATPKPAPMTAPATGVSQVSGESATVANTTVLLPADAREPVANESALDPFKHTRLFELAEGKKTTSLREMLQPAFWIDTIKELVVAAISFVPRLLVSAMFLVVFWLLYRACRRLLSGAMQSSNVDPSIRDMLLALTKWSIMGFGLVIACNQIGIPIVAMLTGVSILGLAVGFAAQETLANFIAGIVIFWDKPFKVGDILTVDGIDGEVQRVTFRSSRLLNCDGQLVVFPNTFMLAHRVTNHTTHPVTRVAIAFLLSGEISISDARAVLLATTDDDDDRIRPEPPPAAAVTKLIDGSVELQLAFWVNDERLVGKMKCQYNEKVKTALDAAGIALASRQMRVTMNSATDEAMPSSLPLRSAA